MLFTAMYAHLESKPDLAEGQLLRRGAKIGKMGNTGKSTANHLHLGLINGIHGSLWRLANIHPSRDHSKQTAYFIDAELFGIEPHITTFYCDSRYNDGKGNWINHPCYDIVPADRHISDKHFNIFWNRSMPGEVLTSGYDDGYGYYVLIGFDA